MARQLLSLARAPPRRRYYNRARRAARPDRRTAAQIALQAETGPARRQRPSRPGRPSRAGEPIRAHQAGRAACLARPRQRVVLVGEYYNQAPRAGKISVHCRFVRGSSTQFPTRSVVQESLHDRAKVSSAPAGGVRRRRAAGAASPRALIAADAAVGRKTAQMAHRARPAQMALTGRRGPLGPPTLLSVDRRTDGVGGPRAAARRDLSSVAPTPRPWRASRRASRAAPRRFLGRRAAAIPWLCGLFDRRRPLVGHFITVAPPPAV